MVLEQNKNKRPFCDGEPCQLASKKHAGQLECNSKLSAFEEIIPCSNLCNELFDSAVADDKWPLRCEGNETLPTHSVDESKDLADGEFQNAGACDTFSVSLADASGGSCGQAWANVFPKEETMGSNSPVEESVSGSCGLGYWSGHVFAQSKEPEFAQIDYYYRKPVAIGPDYQAYVPSWELEHLHSSLSSKRIALAMSANPANSSSVERNMVMVEEDQRRMGSSIIQMPDLESDSYSDKSIGCGRVNCTCLDQGSLRCVRQHIAEEREKLKFLLGPNILMELGFDEMGEGVARRWSIEEENLFQEVVYSNLVSMGKNFWTELPSAFPTRSKKELVSYYFNVFMLRKRALQNQWETYDADSDNDEWQGGDSNELSASEDDEESVMESEPAEHDGHTAVYHVHEKEEEEHDDDDEEEEEEDEEEGIDENEKWEGEEEGVGAVFENVSGELDGQNCFANSPDAGCVSGLGRHLDEPNNGKCKDDQDVLDESSLSRGCYHNGSDFHAAAGTLDIACPEAAPKTQVDKVETGCMNNEYGNKDSGGVFGSGFLSEQTCDSKIWDVGFLPVSRKDVDILPTCSMMKEVFGEETWNNEVLRDSPRIR